MVCEERLRERVESQISSSMLLIVLIVSMFNVLDREDHPIKAEDEEGVSDEIEIKYLSLSWWMSHVGWKDVGERVRRGVEEVFEG